jgi:hypothetical protein
MDADHPTTDRAVNSGTLMDADPAREARRLMDLQTRQLGGAAPLAAAGPTPRILRSLFGDA